MNPVLHEGVEQVRLAWTSAIMTIVFLAVFIGWAAWAFSRRNRKRFEEAAQLPFTTGGQDA